MNKKLAFDNKGWGEFRQQNTDGLRWNEPP